VEFFLKLNALKVSEITVFDAFNSRKMQKNAENMQKKCRKMQKNAKTAEKKKKIQSACFVIQACSNLSPFTHFFAMK
jgi:hypothetical protein